MKSRANTMYKSPIKLDNADLEKAGKNLVKAKIPKGEKPPKEF